MLLPLCSIVEITMSLISSNKSFGNSLFLVRAGFGVRVRIGVSVVLK
jgi:hypothetical protein